MTDQHPLTDDLCCQLWQDNKDNWLKFQEPCPATRRTMRAAADWQLEQVIDWLKNCSMNHSLSYDGEYRSDRYLVINAFREAMRPTTTTQENNND